MARQLMILLFLLCSAGLILNAHGAKSREKKGTQMSSGKAGNSGGGDIAGIIMKGVNSLFDMIMEAIQPLLDTAKSFVMSLLNTVFMSDDTRMAMTRQRRSIDSSNGSSSGGSSIMSMLADVFLAPFKITFGALRDISFNKMVEGVEDVISPIRTILDSSAVHAFTNTSKSVFDAAADEFWNFTKSTVLPELNEAVTTLRNTNTLPKSVNNYLGDLQSLYRICHTLGIV